MKLLTGCVFPFYKKKVKENKKKNYNLTSCNCVLTPTQLLAHRQDKIIDYKKKKKKKKKQRNDVGRLITLVCEVDEH